MPSVSLFLSVKAVIPGVPLKALTRSPEQTPAVSGTRTSLLLGFFLVPPHLSLRGYRALGPSGLDHHNSPPAVSGPGHLPAKGTRVVSVKHITVLQHPSVAPRDGQSPKTPATSFCLRAHHSPTHPMPQHPELLASCSSKPGRWSTLEALSSPAGGAAFPVCSSFSFSF